MLRETDNIHKVMKGSNNIRNKNVQLSHLKVTNAEIINLGNI